MSEERRQRRTATGVVDRDPRHKTLVVKSVTLVRHPKYHRYVRRATLYRVHDETEQARAGDLVEIMETRPISKTKHWRLVRVVTRRAESEKGSEVRP
jgi:small subunit ribosomal protein S17